MDSRLTRIASFMFAFGAAGFLAGCSTPATQTTPASIPPAATTQGFSTNPPSPPAQVPLVVGMSTEDIRGLLGEPAETRPIEAEGYRADIWVFPRTSTAVRQVTTGVREVPYVDPITGLMRSVPEPIIDYVRESKDIDLLLLVFDGKLVNWREVDRGTRKSFH